MNHTKGLESDKPRIVNSEGDWGDVCDEMPRQAALSPNNPWIPTFHRQPAYDFQKFQPLTESKTAGAVNEMFSSKCGRRKQIYAFSTSTNEASLKEYPGAKWFYLGEVCVRLTDSDLPHLHT